MKSEINDNSKVKDNAIQMAIAEFLKKFKADINQYNINITNDQNSIFVTFIDKDAPSEGFVGNPSDRLPAFEVQLSRNDLSIIGSSFIR